MKTDLYTYYDISLSTSYNEKCVKKNVVQNTKTHFVPNTIFPENLAICR